MFEQVSAGGSFTPARQEEWDLSLVGNWAKHKVDLDGDGAYTSTGDFQALGSFNKANEQTSRALDTNNNGSGEHTYTPVYDKAGNRVDDGQRYKAVYDAFGRLVRFTDRASPYATRVEYTYNGLGHRTGWHYDVDGDGTLEAASGDGDPQYWFCYDESWRIVAAYRKTDAAPKERFVYHAAGLGGFGDGSYIDAVVLREKDANSAWNAASDTLEQRVYYLQNWRADVVALVNDFGLPLEYVRYSPYGVPTRTPISEYNGDGVFDGFDYDDFVSDYTAASGYVRALDVNLDGSLDAFDYDDFVNNFLTEQAAGRGVLSGDPMDWGVGNRKGYAGYEFEPALAGIDDDSDSPDDPTALYHVRHRVYDAARGTWTRRDPLGYVDFMNVYEYGRSHPIDIVDPHGQFVQLVCCSTCIGLGIWDLANGWSECANKQSWKERIACGVMKLLPGDKLFAIGDCLRRANDRSSSRERREAIIDCLQGTALDIVHIASCICCIGPAIKPFLRSPPAVPMPTPLVPALGTAVSACCGSYEEGSEFDSHRGAE